MAVRKVVLYPDSILKQRCSQVDWREVQDLCGDLVDTLRAGPGVGLAAPQIGQALRVIAVDVTPKNPGHGLLVLLNPELIEHEGSVPGREGCLSIPEFTGNVARYQRIVVRAQDPLGQEVTLTSEGFEAVCLQHELDHLDGVLFLDRVCSLRNDVFKRKGGRPRYSLEEMVRLLHGPDAQLDLSLSAQSLGGSS